MIVGMQWRPRRKKPSGQDSHSKDGRSGQEASERHEPPPAPQADDDGDRKCSPREDAPGRINQVKRIVNRHVGGTSSKDFWQPASTIAPMPETAHSRRAIPQTGAM